VHYSQLVFTVNNFSQQAQQAGDSGMTAQEQYVRALMHAFYVPEEQSHSYTAAYAAGNALRKEIIDAEHTEHTAEDADEEVITHWCMHNVVHFILHHCKYCCNTTSLQCMHYILCGPASTACWLARSRCTRACACMPSCLVTITNIANNLLGMPSNMLCLCSLQVYSVDLEDLDDFDTGDNNSSTGLAFTLKPIRDTTTPSASTAATSTASSSSTAHAISAPLQVQSYARPLILDKLTDLLTAEPSISVAQAALIRPQAPAATTRTLCTVARARLDHMQTASHVFTVPAAVPYVAHSKDTAVGAATASGAAASAEQSFDLFVDLTVVIEFRGRRQRGSYVRGRLSAVLLVVDTVTAVNGQEAVGDSCSGAVSVKRRRIGYAPHALQAVCSDDELDKQHGKVSHYVHKSTSHYVHKSKPSS
jgi:hypothetical protein